MTIPGIRSKSRGALALAGFYDPGKKAKSNSVACLFNGFLYGTTTQIDFHHRSAPETEPTEAVLFRDKPFNCPFWIG